MNDRTTPERPGIKGAYVKLGWWYVTLIFVATALLVGGIYYIELRHESWTVAHPILDGTIGGAVIIPATGVVALLVVDRRLEKVTRQRKAKQVETISFRLGLALRQSIRAGIYGVIATAGQGGRFDRLQPQELRDVLKEVESWTIPVSEAKIERVKEVMLPYVNRTIDVLQQFSALTENDRASEFAFFIQDGADFMLLGIIASEKKMESQFYKIFATLTEMLVNAAEQVCPGALPLSNGSPRAGLAE